MLVIIWLLIIFGFERFHNLTSTAHHDDIIGIAVLLAIFDLAFEVTTVVLIVRRLIYGI